MCLLLQFLFKCDQRFRALLKFLKQSLVIQVDLLYRIQCKF
jgi:hypothetical protein